MQWSSFLDRDFTYSSTPPRYTSSCSAARGLKSDSLRSNKVVPGKCSLDFAGGKFEGDVAEAKIDGHVRVQGAL